MIKTPEKPASGPLKFLSATALSLLVSVSSLAAQQPEPAADGHEHGFHKNGLGVFIGFTGEDSRSGGGRDRAFTVGIEYERRFSERFGVVVELERAFGDLDFTVITVPLVYHRGPWALSAGPGIEILDHEDQNEFVFRVAGVRVFNRGSYELAPKVGLDFVAGEVVFLGGLVVAFGF